ncbi:undecaprenyl-diphosphatase [Cellvibrio mixtus]|uniref:Undecaprenyl-diphosphatase n=1 Tax=Cellvibrio mixtus TaxID=39650 RepID=A0A266QB17_9GAMM|nr:undecaprenyl-diphosphate phosphatase [Cellvibrio mixtus]OZY87035.1 undecaprenyl-diphosphatase [Cellvibrio mixtus]
MDFILLIKAVVMGIVEGVTELLPISSTGHLILAADLMNFLEDEKRTLFEIFIQMGAMLAIVWEYRRKIFGSLCGAVHPGVERNLFINVALAFFPAALIGFLLSDFIMTYLFSPYVVAGGFIVGGFVIIWVEKYAYAPRIQEMDDLSYSDALKVGLCQCLALIPGTSRSGATIIGGMYFGLSRKASTEFSFFLAIPMISAASLYSLWGARDQLAWSDASVLAVGFVTAFIATFVVMRALLKFISKHTYIAFAWYRIAFGVVVLATAYTGVISWAH